MRNIEKLSSFKSTTTNSCDYSPVLVFHSSVIVGVGKFDETGECNEEASVKAGDKAVVET